MKENVWTKTILSCYRYLERVCSSIDKLVESKALASFYVCSSNFSSSNVINVADKLIELSERKKTLINLKVLTTKVLKKCDRLHAQILIERYIEKDKSDEIALRHNIPIRSYFRKIYSAEKEFSSILTKLGFSDGKLSEFLANEKWIIEVYSRYSSFSREECFSINDYFLKKIALS